MKSLKNHPTMQLREDAADSWDRFERDHGVHPVTSAYRSPADQQALINRWLAGGKYNRPPYLYEPASLAVTKHTKGIGLDTPNAKAVARLSAAYGWRFLFAYDVVHLEYDPAHDQHRIVIGPKSRPVLRRGSKGPDVKDLQTILNRYHGTTLGLDSVFGADTEHAVIMFQRTVKIKPDGIVGSETWRKLGQ